MLKKEIVLLLITLVSIGSASKAYCSLPKCNGEIIIVDLEGYEILFVEKSALDHPLLKEHFKNYVEKYSPDTSLTELTGYKFFYPTYDPRIFRIPNDSRLSEAYKAYCDSLRGIDINTYPLYLINPEMDPSPVHAFHLKIVTAQKTNRRIFPFKANISFGFEYGSRVLKKYLKIDDQDVENENNTNLMRLYVKVLTVPASQQDQAEQKLSNTIDTMIKEKTLPPFFLYNSNYCEVRMLHRAMRNQSVYDILYNIFIKIKDPLMRSTLKLFIREMHSHDKNNIQYSNLEKNLLLALYAGNKDEKCSFYNLPYEIRIKIAFDTLSLRTKCELLETARNQYNMLQSSQNI